MATFIMMVAPSGAGKTTYAENFLVEYYDAVLLSSDRLREQLYGNANDQTHNKQVFDAMNKQTIAVLNQGINVIYDATNLNRERRAALLAELPYCEKICYWVDTPIHQCIAQDAGRERTVGEKVINRQNCQLQVPTYDEGWDKIIRLFKEEMV